MKMKPPKRKPAQQYGGDGLYYLMDGTRRINKTWMAERDA